MFFGLCTHQNLCLKVVLGKNHFWQLWKCYLCTLSRVMPCCAVIWLSLLLPQIPFLWEAGERINAIVISRNRLMHTGVYFIYTEMKISWARTEYHFEYELYTHANRILAFIYSDMQMYGSHDIIQTCKCMAHMTCKAYWKCPLRGVIHVLSLNFKTWYVALLEGSRVIVGISTRHQLLVTIS